MRIFHTKKMMFVLFVLGFLIGILYVNLASGQFVADSGVFSDYFLNQYASVTICTEEYVIYLMGIRLVPFLIMVGLSFTKMRKVSAYIFLVWTGFSGGMLLSMAAYSMGSRGILLCMAGIFPHFLFYIPAYLVVLWYAVVYPQNRWNRQKTIFVVLMLAMGLVLEGCVNPVLMRMFVKLM